MAEPALNNQEKFLTLSQVAHFTKIPLATLRKYVAKYGSFMALSRGEKNKLLFDRATMEKLVNIRVWVGERKPTKEIRNLLQGNHLVKQESSEPASQTLVPSGHDAQSDLVAQRIAVFAAKVDNLTSMVMENARTIETLEKENMALKQQLHKVNNRAETMVSRVVMLEAHQVEVSAWMENQSLWNSIKKLFKGRSK